MKVFYGAIFYFLLFFCSFSAAAQQSIPEGLLKDSADFKIWKLNINSTASDFSAVPYGKGILFTSDRDREFGVVHYDKDTRKQLLNLFYSERKDSFRFSSPTCLSPASDAPAHIGPACCGAGGKTLYYTSSAAKKKGGLRILSAHLENGKWVPSSSIRLPDTTLQIAQPAISPDGNTLYFVSDMKGGYGGTDLYRSIRKENSWSAPENLGPDINTNGNESFPFIDSQGHLFFSSDGRVGMGKLDIYRVSNKGRGRYNVENMGYPINSSEDDFGYSCDSSQNAGFFSSNRVGKKDELYGFYAVRPPFCKCDTVKDKIYCFTFFEESANIKSQTEGLAYEWDFGDSTRSKSAEADHCFDRPGMYAIKLNVIDKSTGVLFFNQAAYDFEVSDFPQLYIDLPDTVPARTSMEIDASKSHLKNFTIDKYFWKMDDGENKKGQKIKYAFAKTGVHQIQLAVFAISDSLKRRSSFCTIRNIVAVAPEVYKASLRKKEISFRNQGKGRQLNTLLDLSTHKDSLTYKVHLGSSKTPIPTKAAVFKGLPDVKEYKDGGVYRYTSGEAKKLIDMLPNYRAAKLRGFKDATVIAFFKDSLIPHQEVSMTALVSDSIRYEGFSVFFGSSEYKLQPRDEYLLDSIACILVKNPLLRVEVIAHADRSGNPELNQPLSEQRAASVKDYLVSKGCAEKRIKVSAFGSDSPITDPSDNDPFYRRADVIIHE
jgi:outer membrane protein OmpA-like peptidoglycan-associated protein